MSDYATQLLRGAQYSSPRWLLKARTAAETDVNIKIKPEYDGKYCLSKGCKFIASTNTFINMYSRMNMLFRLTHEND